MTNKVLQFINRKEFLESKYPNVSCYLKTLILDDDSFSKKEKKEIFNYFFYLRKKLELPYFTTYYYGKTDTITEANFFNDIIDIIVNSLESEIKNILDKDNIDSQDIFDLFDYIVCVSRHIDKNKIIEYVNNSLLAILNMLESNHTKEDEKKIQSSIYMIKYIDINISYIEDNLYKIIYFIDQTKNIGNKLVLELSKQIGFLLKKEENIDNVNKDIILFILSNFNRNINNYDIDSVISIKLILNILDKINDIDFEIKIFSYTFPNWLKDILSNNYSYYLFIQFMLIKKIHQKGCIEKLEPKQKDFLFKYIAFHLINTDFKLKIEDEEIDLSKLKKTISNYIIDIFEVYEGEDSFLYSQIIINYIDSQEKYDKCSKKVKKYRISLILSSDDPIYNIKEDDEEINNILKVKQENIEKLQKLRYKIEKYKEDKENEKINCIKKFFNFEAIKEDIGFILKQFDNKCIITEMDFYKLNNKYEYLSFDDKNKIIDDSFSIPIFNPFCIFYIYEIFNFDFLYQEEVDLNIVYKYLIDNWNNFYILHLYNYLIAIRKYDYNFSNEEKEIIRNYFKNINIQFPKYILLHLEKVFGFDIDLKRFIDDKSIIELLSYPYYFIKECPCQILISDRISIKYPVGRPSYVDLEFETFNFNSIIKKLNIDKYYLLDLCIKHIDIENAINFPSYKYYFLVSTINLYNSVDNKIKYTDKIKEIILEYFKATLDKSNNGITHISTLLIDSVIKLDLMNDLLKLILNSNFIGICHYNIISQWQDSIIFDNLYNKDLLDIIYEIREKIRKKEIKITEHNNINNSYNLKKYCDELIKKINDMMSIKDTNEQFKLLTDISNDINIKLEGTVNKEVLYYEHDNIASLLIFIDKNNEIFKYFCNFITNDYNVQEEAIKNLDYIFDNIEKYKNSFIKVTYVINQIYDKLDKKIEYPECGSYYLVFELRVIIEYIIDKIIKTDYYFDEQVYDNLLKVTELEPKTEDEKEFLKNLEKRLIYKKTLLISPIKIYKDKSLSIYFIENKHGDKTSYDNLEKLLQNLNNRFNKTAKISRILEFEHLVKDIENRCITMSHPYLFEYDNENQYDIKNKLYISCFSYSIGNENAYAWWKIYGSKTKFRMTIDIKDFIKSIMSILYNHNVEIYLGSLYYMDKEKIKSKNENVWDFFDKRNDFKFENELRLIIEINNEIKNTDSGSIKIENIKGLPILCSFPIKELDMYKNMSTDEKDIIFHPYDKTLLYKDKKAMLSILEELKSKI